MKIYKISNRFASTNNITNVEPFNAEAQNVENYLKYILENLGTNNVPDLQYIMLDAIEEKYSHPQFTSITNLIKQIKNKEDTNANSQQQNYNKTLSEERENEKKIRQDTKSTVDKYWQNHNLQEFFPNEDALIPQKTTLNILIDFIKTLFPHDFSTELAIKNKEEEDYASGYQEITLEDLLIHFLVREDKSEIDLRGLMEQIKSETTGYSQFNDFIQYFFDNDDNFNFSYMTIQKSKSIDENTKNKEEEKRKIETEQFEHQQNAIYDEAKKRFNEKRKEKGLEPADENSQEFQDYIDELDDKINGRDIEDEAAWQTELLKDFKYWIKDNPFAGTHARQEFFKEWYNQFNGKQNNNTYNHKQEQQQQNSAKKSEKWKSIDDILLFATKNGIDLSALDKTNVKEACKKIYRTLVNYFHPDKYPDPKKKMWAEEQFKILQNLWTDFQKNNI